MGIGAALLGTAAIGAGTSVLSSSAQSKAASTQAASQTSAASTQAQADVQAAQIQADAATKAAQLQEGNFQQTEGNLSPYLQAGVSNLPALENMLTNPTPLPTLDSSSLQQYLQPFNPTQAQLEATPGYEFTLSQGLKSAQNSYAAEGLGQSGAAEKGAIDYATGLAGTTYQQQFSNYLAQNQQNLSNTLGIQNQQYNQAYNTEQQQFNQLAGVVGSGQNAAAGLGSLSLQNTGAVNALNTAGAAATAAGTAGAGSATAAGTVGAANASAAGTIGSANALTSGATGLGNNALSYALLSNNGMFGGSSSGGADLQGANDLIDMYA